MPLKKGDRAPDFSLFRDDKEPFTLSEALGSGPVVILFFPGAFTGTCTTEMNTVNNDLSAYGPDATIVGISTDSPFALAEFRKAQDLSFHLLSDHEANVCRLYGAKYDRNFSAMKLDRIARRAAFVVDREGIIQYAEVLENAGNLPDLEAVKAAVNGR